MPVDTSMYKNMAQPAASGSSSLMDMLKQRAQAQAGSAPLRAQTPMTNEALGYLGAGTPYPVYPNPGIEITE